MKKLIVFDIDGTLWNPVYGLSQSTFAAIWKLYQDGHHLCISTGRTRNSIPDPIRRLPVCSWITSDGAVIDSSFFHTKTSIPLQKVNEVLEEAFRSCWGISLECPTRIYMNQTACDFYTAMNEEKNMNSRLEKILYEDSISQWSSEIPVYKICLIVPVGSVAPPSFADLDFLKISERLIELHPPGTNKGTALTVLQNHLGFSRKDTICVADGKNDLAMLEACTYFIAMQESCDEVKRKADYICPTTMDSAIARGFEHIGLLPIETNVFPLQSSKKRKVTAHGTNK